MAQTPYTPRSFTLPEVSGISKKTLETHLKLYEGYVKHANLILEKLNEYGKDSTAHTYAMAELQRRFAFEFDGMRNHEHYFAALEGGPSPLSPESALAQAMIAQWGSVDACLARLKTIAATRGIGWAMLSYDMVNNPPTGEARGQLTMGWVDEQHLGHLTGLTPVVALDMWEHSYFLDYAPADKGQYAEAYLNAMNWESVAKGFEKLRM